jgi:predicted esterase
MSDPRPLATPATDAPPVEARQIATRIHGHYLVASPPGPGPRPLLVGFHGYGETAEDHLDELRRLPGAEGWRICAVQGLAAFYRAKTGEVVASWMTRFNRELAIADNLAYAAAVVEEIEGRWPAGGPRVYAGFSQGVAMAYRAATRSRRPAGVVLALGGDLPPELTAGDLGALDRVLIGRGADDVWYDAAKMDADLGRLRAAGVAAESLVFGGGHQWTDAFRRRAGEVLAEVAAG